MSPVGCHVEQQRSSLTTPDCREPPKFGPGPSKWHSSWQMPGTACGNFHRKSETSTRALRKWVFFYLCILWYLMVSHHLMESRSLFGRIEHLGCPAPLRWDSGSPFGRLWDHLHAVLHKSWGAQWRLWSIGNSWQLMSITLQFQKTMIKTSAKLWTSVGWRTGLGSYHLISSSLREIRTSESHHEIAKLWPLLFQKCQFLPGQIPVAVSQPIWLPVISLKWSREIGFTGYHHPFQKIHSTPHPGE